MTDDTPRHSTRRPSVFDILVTALPMPVYMAAGDVWKTCIRVCERLFSTGAWCAARVARSAFAAKISTRTYFYRVKRKHDRVFRDASLRIYGRRQQSRRRGGREGEATHQRTGQHVDCEPGVRGKTFILDFLKPFDRHNEANAAGFWQSVAAARTTVTSQEAKVGDVGDARARDKSAVYCM